MTKEEKIEDFVEFPISMLMPESPLPTDIYLYIDKKHIKYKSEGDFLESAKINYFLSKGVQNLFVRKGDVDRMEVGSEEALKKEIEGAVAEIGEDARAIVEQKVELRHKLFDVFAEQELSSANVKMLQGMSQHFIADLTKRADISILVAKLQVIGDLAMDHALNVGNMAVFIAMASGQGDQDFLQNLFVASLLHDYGKIKIPPSVSEKGQSAALTKAIQDHPTKGGKYVRTIKSLPEVVAVAVEQHHEQFNGRGYPKKLDGENINVMARFLSVANIYDNILIENKNKTPDDAHKLAIKSIEYDRSKHFDPLMLPRMVDALKLAFGNYYTYK